MENTSKMSLPLIRSLNKKQKISVGVIVFLSSIIGLWFYYSNKSKATRIKEKKELNSSTNNNQIRNENATHELYKRRTNKLYCFNTYYPDYNIFEIFLDKDFRINLCIPKTLPTPSVIYMLFASGYYKDIQFGFEKLEQQYKSLQISENLKQECLTLASLNTPNIPIWTDQMTTNINPNLDNTANEVRNRVMRAILELAAYPRSKLIASYTHSCKNQLLMEEMHYFDLGELKTLNLRHKTIEISLSTKYLDILKDEQSKRAFYPIKYKRDFKLPIPKELESYYL